MTRILNIWNALRSSLWVIPSLMSVAAVILSMAAGELDALLASSTSDWMRLFLYNGDLEGARSLLSTVAGSMITVAGVTFSVTIVALSLASSQFGPRLLLHFMRDRGNQIVLGTFIATFLYCLIALGNGSKDELPAASASFGLLLALFNVGVLIYFIHHVTSSIRAEHVVDVVVRDVERAVAGLLQSEDKDENNESADLHEDTMGSSSGEFVTASRNGYIQALNESSLVSIAAECDVVIRMMRRPGHFVVEGGPLAIVVPATGLTADVTKRVRRNILIGRHRTDEQDPEFGIHQLVEVAVRALSPSLNDPHTAILCINWLNAALQRVAAGRIRSSIHYDQDGTLRLVTDPVTFEGLVAASFDQIRQFSATMPAVSIHLMDALASLARTGKDASQAGIIRKQADELLAGTVDAGLQQSDRDDLEARYHSVIQALET